MSLEVTKCFRNGQTGGLNVMMARARVAEADHGETVERQGLQEMRLRSGQGGRYRQCLHFGFFDGLIFGDVIGVREEFANGGDAGAAGAWRTTSSGSRANFAAQAVQTWAHGGEWNRLAHHPCRRAAHGNEFPWETMINKFGLWAGGKKSGRGQLW